MPAVTLRQLLEAGVHFGHQTSRWNPRMRPYIFTARNGIHIIDLEQTQKQLDVACDYLKQVVADGQKVLFVGTKKQAQDVIEEVCKNTGQAYVTHRWMGGMLTNFTVIQRRLRRLAELRVMQQRGDFERMSGKEANDAKDDLERLENNFAGMAEMKRVPGAVFVIDCKKERIAVTEANKLGIPIVAIVDTNCDPDVIQVVIPGNDDAMRSCRLIVSTIGQAIAEGLQQFSEREMQERQEAERRDREAAEAAEAAAALAAEAAAVDAAHADAVAAAAADEQPAEAVPAGAAATAATTPEATS
jgi:small subunit ribosomal protein S2